MTIGREKPSYLFKEIQVDGERVHRPTPWHYRNRLAKNLPPRPEVVDRVWTTILMRTDERWHDSAKELKEVNFYLNWVEELKECFIEDLLNFQGDPKLALLNLACYEFDKAFLTREKMLLESFQKNKFYNLYEVDRLFYETYPHPFPRTEEEYDFYPDRDAYIAQLSLDIIKRLQKPENRLYTFDQLKAELNLEKSTLYRRLQCCEIQSVEGGLYTAASLKKLQRFQEIFDEGGSYAEVLGRLSQEYLKK